MGNGLYMCPWAEGWAGYAASRTYYPPNHPDPPAESVVPARCFSSAAEAVLAGYRLAPTPAGYVLAGDVYLQPPNRAVGEGCAKAARMLRFAVPCPTLVPTSYPGTEGGPTCAIPTPPSDPGTPNCTDGPFFLISQAAIDVPPDFYQVGCCGALLVIAYRGTPPVPTEGPWDVCGAPVPRSNLMVGSSRAEVLYCPSDITRESNHLILRLKGATSVRGGPVTVDVAIGSDDRRALDVIEAVALHIRFVPPH